MSQSPSPALPTGCTDNHRATITTHGRHRTGTGQQLAVPKLISSFAYWFKLNIVLHCKAPHSYPICSSLLWAGWSVTAYTPPHNRRARAGRVGLLTHTAGLCLYLLDVSKDLCMPGNANLLFALNTRYLEVLNMCLNEMNFFPGS